MSILNPARRRGLSALRAAALTLVVAAAVAGACWAGPLQDANQAYNQGDYRQALNLLRDAERSEPNNPVVHHALGLTLRRLGERDAARAAFDRVLTLDPSLRSIRDDAKFWQAYESVGGDARAATAAARRNTSPRGGGGGAASLPTEMIRALTEGDVFVVPGLKGDVDTARLEQAARAARPTKVKIVAVGAIGRYRTRDEFAGALRQALDLGDDGAVVVGTPRGVSASSGRLSREQVNEALKEAKLDQAFARGGLTDALTLAAQTMGGTVRTDQRTDTNRTGTLIFLGLAGLGTFGAYRVVKKKREMDAARFPVEALRRKAVDNLSYVDGYLDLLPAGPDAERARTLRQSAYDEYATAAGTLEQAQTPDAVLRAKPMLERALADLEECRIAIDKATGGTGVAMSIPELPSLQTDRERAATAARLKPVEQVRDEREAQEMQRRLEQIPEDERGVSFFSGQPAPRHELVPVTMVIDGQKREVLATREEAEAIQRGETPRVRAFEEDGRQVPWHENRRYDPYRDYYGGWGYGGGMGSLVDLYLLTHLFGGGLFGGYGGWGGWGYGPTVVNNHYHGGGGVFGGGETAAAPEVEHTGGVDFFGQQGYDETSSDGGFDLGGFFGGGGGDSGGGFDFGGGDFGGGDFGGGD
jgi:thioredoxin-like negative regulator of GroEL